MQNRNEEIDAAIRRFEDCTLCPRNCHSDRTRGELGFCRVSSELAAARAALHMWEEPCISGERGSGAVFFSGCSLGCVYCQNKEIAAGTKGAEISWKRLAEIFLELQEKGAANINLVTAGHYVPWLIPALEQAKEQGLRIPVVYNSGGYEKPGTLKLLEGLVDVYLPDFKYMDPELGKRYSHAPDYAQRAKEAIQEMVRQSGDCVFDERGYIRKGTIVRHLILPGHTRDSRKILSYLHETYGDHIYISIMNQYTPLPHAEAYPEISRKVTVREYEKVLDHALSLGITQGYFQEGDTAMESFIPAFDQEGI